MSFDFSTLITDRSQADVEALRALLSTALTDWTAEQLAAFNQAASRGAYNYTDLNRVTAAMDDLNERLTALGYETGYQQIVVPHQESGGSVLPEGYTQVAWIESTGSQYISGITIPSDFKISLTISAETTGAYMNIYDNHAASPMLWIDGNKALEMNTVKSSYTLGNDKTKIVSDATGSENTLSVNGSLVQTLPKVSGIEFPITLFNRDGQQCFVGRIYHLAIASSTSDLFDFVPCQDPTGAAGLYDLVNGQFYGNDGTGAFLAGPVVVDLPEGYTQLEYIQSSGTQYIDTGFKPTNNTRVTCESIFPLNGETNVLFGLWDLSTSSGYAVYRVGDYYRNDFGPDYSQKITGISADDFTVFDKNKNTLTIGNQTVESADVTFSFDLNLYLFGRNLSGNAESFSAASMRYLKIYAGSELVRDYVPCVDPSGEIGLYDLVNGTSCANAGTGTFAAGPEMT